MNNWSCLPAAFAIVLGVPLDEVVRSLGHDGSEVVPEWAHLPEPYRRRSFHIQELVAVARDWGYAVVPHEPMPAMVSSAGTQAIPLARYQPNWPDNFVSSVMRGSSGVLTGETLSGGRHAVAWLGDRIVDPSGVAQDLAGFKLRCFWRVVRIES